MAIENLRLVEAFSAGLAESRQQAITDLEMETGRQNLADRADARARQQRLSDMMRDAFEPGDDGKARTFAQAEPLLITGMLREGDLKGAQDVQELKATKLKTLEAQHSLGGKLAMGVNSQESLDLAITEMQEYGISTEGLPTRFDDKAKKTWNGVGRQMLGKAKEYKTGVFPTTIKGEAGTKAVMIDDEGNTTDLKDDSGNPMQAVSPRPRGGSGAPPNVFTGARNGKQLDEQAKLIFSDEIEPDPDSDTGGTRWKRGFTNDLAVMGAYAEKLMGENPRTVGPRSSLLEAAAMYRAGKLEGTSKYSTKPEKNSSSVDDAPEKNSSSVDDAPAGGKMDKAKASEYLARAGGDKAKARELAKKDGWSF